MLSSEETDRLFAVQYAINENKIIAAFTSSTSDNYRNVSEQDRARWDSLHPAIREVAVDVMWNSAYFQTRRSEMRDVIWTTPSASSEPELIRQTKSQLEELRRIVAGAGQGGRRGVILSDFIDAQQEALDQQLQDWAMREMDAVVNESPAAIVE